MVKGSPYASVLPAIEEGHFLDSTLASLTATKAGGGGRGSGGGGSGGRSGVVPSKYTQPGRHMSLQWRHPKKKRL